MRVNSIIKIELIINTEGGSCAAIASLFIKVLWVSELAICLVQGRILSVWLCNFVYGLLHIQEIKTEPSEPKAIG